jgi:hypothetical protein
MAWNRPAALALMLGGVLLGVTRIQADEPAAPAEPPPTPPVLRVYDVHDLLEPARDYHLYDVARAAGFASGVFSDQAYPQMGTPSPNPMEQQATTRQQLTDDLIKSLETNVAPDSWRDNGGTEGTVRASDGMLTVTEPPANQKLVKDFLDQMSEWMSATVRVEADWVWVSADSLAKLLPNAGPTNSAAGAVQEVDAARLASLPAGIRHVHAEIAGRNGQTMFVVSGREKSLVSNVTPIVSTATSSFAPTVSAVAGGAALEVKAMAKPERGYAILVLAGGYDELGPTRPASAAAVAGTAFDSPPATQPSPASQPAAPPRLPSDAHPSPRPAAGVAQSPFETISMKVQELRTTLRVPLGRPVIAARATWDPTGGDHQNELVLIITVHTGK